MFFQIINTINLDENFKELTNQLKEIENKEKTALNNINVLYNTTERLLKIIIGFINNLKMFLFIIRLD
ncbi:hypothetical protein HERIO_297 [Hepatospora eriocheir]|uniref:Uncharacterized protein n=1 Tax=Hepatospora eriocheir TaxID=1081669 RepID=A0A1X0QDR4_9MICR|nr:hypothetical protein HERIO_297 [Hepatospora eriocheir]